MNNADSQMNNTEFTIEWKDNELTALTVTSGEKTAVVRFDSKASCLFEMDEQGDSCALLESLADRFCELTGIRFDISDVFSNLLRVEHGSDLEQKLFFADFPDVAKDKFAINIHNSSKYWCFNGDEFKREAKINEFISYVIYFRRFFSFVKCENAINVGLIYINKKCLENEWLAFTQNMGAFCDKFGLPPNKNETLPYFDMVKRFTNLWIKQEKSAWKYLVKEVVK